MGVFFWVELFFWIYLVGIVVVLLALLIMMLGLVLGIFFFVYGLELIFLIVVGWLLVMVM